jgi:transcriptional regulator with PAS, ATPase and Fis domain
VAATNIEFKKAFSNGTFREDLYYRLNVIPIHLPPLRERLEDIPIFLQYFLDKFNKELNRKIDSFDLSAIELLQRYSWPGNVRELQNIVERLVTLSRNQNLTAQDVDKALNLSRETSGGPVGELGFDAAVENFERNYIKRMLESTAGNRSQAAKIMGVARTTLISKIEKLGLS